MTNKNHSQQDNEMTLDDIIEHSTQNNQSLNSDDIVITQNTFSNENNQSNEENTFVDPFATMNNEQEITKNNEIISPEIITEIPKKQEEDSFVDPFMIKQNENNEIQDNTNNITKNNEIQTNTILEQTNQNEEREKEKEKENEKKNKENKKTKKTKKSRTGFALPFIIIAILILGITRLIKHKSDGTTNITDITANTGNIETGNVKITFTTWSIDTGKQIEENPDKTKIPQTNNNSKTQKLDDYYSINTEENIALYKGNIINNANTKTFEALWNKYAKDQNTVYYQWKALKNIEPNKFKVINTNGNYELQWIIVTSKNLMKHLEKKENREFLMTTIASVTNKNINVKDQLTQASIYSMDSFKNDFKELEKLQRWDDMTDVQKAKFGVIFLYIKLIKSLESDKIRMSIAKEELSYFLKHSDEIINKYWKEQEKTNSINWNIWYDEYCVYNNWELFGCFLNKIFISETQID